VAALDWTVDAPATAAAPDAALARFVMEDPPEINQHLERGGEDPALAEQVALIRAALHPSDRNNLLHFQTSFKAAGLSGPIELLRRMGQVHTVNGFWRVALGDGIFPGRAQRLHVEIEAPTGTRMAWLKEYNSRVGDNAILLDAGARMVPLQLSTRVPRRSGPVRAAGSTDRLDRTGSGRRRPRRRWPGRQRSAG